MREEEIIKKTLSNTVKLDFKELLNKEQIDFKELFTDYQLFYIINLLLNKELMPIKKMQKLGIKEHEIVKISKKGDFQCCQILS